MTIKTTIATQTAQKMKLEARLRPILRKFFRNINNDIAIRYTATEQIGTFNQYRDELVGILKDHYRITSKQFRKKSQSKGQSEIDLATSLTMNEYIDEHAPQQADIMLNTTADEANRSLASIIRDLFVAGIVVEATGVSKLLKKDLNSKVAGRSNIIAMTETQNLAEKTKFTEGMIEGGYLQIENIPKEQLKEVTKTWISVGDATVRATHQAADGQIQPINEPYVVGGSLLMFPGDTSMLPDMVEIYNCRCISLNSFD